VTNGYKLGKVEKGGGKALTSPVLQQGTQHAWSCTAMKVPGTQTGGVPGQGPGWPKEIHVKEHRRRGHQKGAERTTSRINKVADAKAMRARPEGTLRNKQNSKKRGAGEGEKGICWGMAPTSFSKVVRDCEQGGGDQDKRSGYLSQKGKEQTSPQELEERGGEGKAARALR